MKKIIHIITGILCAVLLTTSCSDELTPQQGVSGGMGESEAVMFTTYVPSRPVTRETLTEFKSRMSAYKAVAANYVFNIEMYEAPATPEAAPTLLGSGEYKPVTTIENEGKENETIHYDGDGTLTANTPLYWPGNSKKYGFKATAGSEMLATDQSTDALLLQQDRLLGYGFAPVYTGTEDNVVQTDNETDLNFRTIREWRAANESLGMDDASEYKKIPLYLRHQRSLITIRLKAGEGVDRNALTYANAVGDEETLGHITTRIFSYAGGSRQEITPKPKQTTIDYVSSDDGGAADDVETTEYSAVVEPYNYKTNPSSDVIASINLSGQRFTFYASNDSQYGNATAETPVEAAVAHMEGYNLQPGQHLVITVTLGRESRKILITAYIEDWTEAVTSSIVDDYGQAGDPVQISTRQQLYEFLSDPKKNKAGSVAIIVPNSLNLEKDGEETLLWNYNTDGTETNDLVLHATLNLAGATLRTDHPIFKEIRPTGNIVNGTITVGTDKNADISVASAIADVNYGSIEHINVLAKDVNGNDSKAYATHAALVRSNSGTITGSTSELRVSGTSGVVGGIAAESVYSAVNGNTMPVIDGCTVNARVSGVTRSKDTEPVITVGGGIVGNAVGRVTNNTFAYGRTVLQHQTDFKNSIYAKADDTHELRASGNAWPTDADNFTDAEIAAGANENGIPTTNINTASVKYTGVIDSQAELAALVSTTYGYNITANSFRMSSDFTVTKEESALGKDDGWKYGTKQTITNETGAGNVLFKLDGDNHTITTDAMLFSNITGEVRNLTVKLNDNLIATPTKDDTDKYDGQDIMAALAYSVIGGTLSNVKVKGGDYRIQASTVGGIVVWARGGATIENCQCKANIQLWVNATGVTSDESKKYAGGIVAEAADATITRCLFHSSSGTLFRNKTADYNTAGTKEMWTDTSEGLYYGGILGGTAAFDSENPSVTITDCSSWFSTSENVYKGAIVGYALYRSTAGGSTKLEYGIANGCQGNWWGESDRAVGTFTADGCNKTIEELLGKKNAVKPTADTSY